MCPRRARSVCLAAVMAGVALAAALEAQAPRAELPNQDPLSAEGTSLDVQLGAADVTIVGDDQPRVRLSPRGASRSVSAQGVRIVRDNEGVVRVRSSVDGASATRPRVRIDAPTSLPLTLTLDQGDVRIDGLRGGASARVVRGSIAASGLHGRVRLETETGSIDAAGVRLSDGDSLRCRTFNGNVVVWLAALPTDARILALTLNGAVTSDIPLTARAAFGPRFGETTLGAGTHVLNIDVVRGDVSIRSAKPPSGKPDRF